MRARVMMDDMYVCKRENEKRSEVSFVVKVKGEWMRSVLSAMNMQVRNERRKREGEEL